MTSSGRVVLLGMLLAGPLAAQASDVRLPATLEHQVTAEVARRWGVTGDRIQLAWSHLRDADALRDGMTAKVLGTGRGGQFAVTFDGGERRLVATLRAGLRDTVAVASRYLARGTELEDGDVTWQETVTWGPPQEAGPHPGPGWMTRRAIEAGQPLTGTAVKPPLLVVAGEPVTLTWRSGSVQVAVEGTAAGSGALGDAVAIRIPGRPGRLRGTVTGAGTARLGS